MSESHDNWWKYLCVSQVFPKHLSNFTVIPRQTQNGPEMSNTFPTFGSIFEKVLEIEKCKIA